MSADSKVMMSMRAAVMLLIAVAAPAWSVTPTVVSTEPSNGATGVAADLETVIINFSSEMQSGYSFSGLGGPWTPEWSPDHRTLTVTRPASEPSWSDGTVKTIILNPAGYIGFFAVDGDPLGTYTFSFTVGGAADPGAPTVTATAPGNGALEVARDRETLELGFSEPMAEGTSISGGSSWPISFATPRSWSPDRTTLTISRDNAASLLEPSTVITVRLNPEGNGFEDEGGTPLGTYTFSFTTESPGADEKPEVVSSDPENGTSAAGRFTGQLEITFSKPMESTSALRCPTGNWQIGDSWWSGDSRTITVTRSDQERLLPAGERVDIVLNPAGEEGFRDVYGNPLDTTTISFTVEDNSRLIKVLPEDSTHDFDWPYYLWIPSGLDRRTVLLVEPNNTGTTSDLEMIHDGSAVSLVGWRARFAAELGVPLLVPTFPRPSTHWQIYTHALDRDCLTTTVEGLERIDLQLIEMIDDARERLESLGHQAGQKVFMMGFSASGQFTSRFAILHPERVLAAAPGSPGGWPLAPVASWQGETLDYHVGIADVASLTGSPLDMAAVRAVPIYLYMGDADTNDSVPFTDGYEEYQSEQVNRLFGTTPVERWPHAEEIYASAGMNATFVLYPGVGHTITNQMLEDLKSFFSSYKPQQIARFRRPLGRRLPTRGR
jgi:hypothetical protein